MAYPGSINTALPSDPTTISPNSLRQLYSLLRTALNDVVSELGSDPGGSGTVQTRVEALEAPLGLSTKTGSYTLALVDAATVVEMNSVSGTAITVPPNSSVAFPVGTIIEVCRIGSGAVTIAPGSGVTLRSPDGNLALRAQWSSASLRKRATDEWVVAGDLA